MKNKILNPMLPALLLLTLSPAMTVTAGGCFTAEAEIAIRNFQSADSTLTNLFRTSAGYAVFPRVGKAGTIADASHRSGVVYENGKPTGEATLTETNVAAQTGREAFYELIFFETDAALANFKKGQFEMSAKMNPVAAAEGAALITKYRDGVLVFTLPRSGLMAQIAVGGQRFDFKPLASTP